MLPNPLLLYIMIADVPQFLVISGLSVPAACLIGMSYVGCNNTLAVALLCIAGSFDGISQPGYGVNHLDIAPKYAGT